MRSLSVETSGCTAITSESVCEREGDAEIRVLLPIAATSQVTFTTEHGSVHERERVVVEGGLRFAIAPPSGVAWLVARGREGAVPFVARIALASARRPAWLVEAQKARKAGDFARAMALAAPHVEDDRAGGDADERVVAARARSVVGRVHLAEGRLDDAERFLRDAGRLYAESARASEAADEHMTLAYLLAHRRFDVAGARLEMDAAGPLLRVYPDGAAFDALYRA
ncbi:MAG TPA: hypothetical protein VM580_32345, partial [Labilithrix sp.]|nr:hypothetical protein [Labilithrix sp.]